MSNLSRAQVEALNTTEPGEKFFIPDRHYIESLKIGDRAPATLGGPLGIISKITYRGVDVEGRLFICYYTRTSETSEVSHSLKEGEIADILRAQHDMTADDLRWIEKVTAEARRLQPALMIFLEDYEVLPLFFLEMPCDGCGDRAAADIRKKPLGSISTLCNKCARIFIIDYSRERVKKQQESRA